MSRCVVEAFIVRRSFGFRAWPAAFAALLTLSAVLWGGCGSDDGGGDDAPAVDAVTSATPLNDHALNEGHPGWGLPGCFDCHENPHQNGLPIAGCAVCHGGNGATERPLGHADDNCAACHASSHAGLDVASPGGCRACHAYVSGAECPATFSADAVVVGAGGGGLAAAAALALAGKKVTLIERHNKVGGYMTNFHRGPYTFEVSLHAMGGLDEGGGTRAMFEKLDILRRLTPIKLAEGYKIVMPDMSLVVPAADAAYEQQLKDLFPEDAAHIGELFAYLRDTNVFFKELSAALAAGDAAWEEFFDANKGPVLELFATMNMTLDDFLKDYFVNERLHMVFTQLASYVGASPAEVQAAFFLVMWFGYTFDGYYYMEGGSQAISDAMAAVVEENGGTIVLNTAVTQIEVEEGKVVGVRTAGGACWTTNTVISNASAPATLFELVGRDKLPAEYVAKVEAMPTSISALVLYLGVDRDYRAEFEGAHEMFVNESYDQAQNYGWFYNNDLDRTPYLLTNYSLLEDGIAPAGHNVLVMAVYLDYEYHNTWDFFTDRDAYRELKDEIAWRYIMRAETLLPELSKHVVSLSVATPPTLEAFTRNPGGTFYGFHNTPEHALLNRLEQETPIAGLFLAGQWTFPGPGQSAVMQSGVSAAQKALATEGE